MFFKTVLILFLGAVQESWAKQFDFILPLKDHFYINNPFIISESRFNDEMNLFKKFSNHGEYVSFKKSSADISGKSRFKSDIILIPNSFKEFVNEVDYLKPYQNKIIAILDSILFEQVLEKIGLEINQEIYFVKASTNEIFESYIINDVGIKRKLGKLCKDEFVWEPDITLSFIARRSNFQGLILTAFTEEGGRDLMIDSKYRKIAPYFESNQTYLVNGFISGMHHDILKLLELNLNFTTLLYKPKKTVWGFVSSDNGTITGTGMIGKIYKKQADFILANVALIYER